MPCPKPRTASDPARALRRRNLPFAHYAPRPRSSSRNNAIILSDQLFRPRKQATAMKIPSKTPVPPYILDNFLLVNQCANRQLFTRNENAAQQLLTPSQNAAQQLFRASEQLLPSPNASAALHRSLGLFACGGASRLRVNGSLWLTMSHLERQGAPAHSEDRERLRVREANTAGHPEPRGAPAGASGDSLTRGARGDSVGGAAQRGPAARRKHSEGGAR